MNLDLLGDPLFRLPWATGTAVAAALPLVGMFLRLRDEWVAALALAQAAAAGAVVAAGLGVAAMAGGAAASVAVLGVKAVAGGGAAAYIAVMLFAWASAVLFVANHPSAEQAARALFDGQIYFTGAGELGAALAMLAIVAGALRLLARPLLAARFFPGLLRSRGRDERRDRLRFDVLAAAAIGLATASIGVMATFALVFVPPWIAYRWCASWRRATALAVAVGVAGHFASFALALVLDQPYGPVNVLVLVAGAAAGAALRSWLSVRRSRVARPSA